MMLETIAPVQVVPLSPKGEVSANSQVVELIRIVKPQAIELKGYASTVRGAEVFVQCE